MRTLKKTLAITLVALMALFAAPLATANEEENTKELEIVKGELIRDLNTIAKVSQDTDLDAEKATSSENHILIQNEDDKYILVKTDERITMMASVTKIRAKGMLKGNLLNAKMVEGYCAESGTWLTLVSDSMSKTGKHAMKSDKDHKKHAEMKSDDKMHKHAKKSDYHKKPGEHSVEGRLVLDKETIKKAHQNSDLNAKKAASNDNVILILNDDKEYMLVTTANKIMMMDTVSLIRAEGQLEGKNLEATRVEGYCSDTEKWHTLFKAKEKKNMDKKTSMR